MSQFFISCKESKIENNKSFYGCFSLGPFEPSQSITIANSLRRTLLSELYGLAIVSIEIDGATHEYSSLSGVRDSVLDILLNFKEIVLKKTIKNFKPQIGYLRARGPGVVRAGDLRLPAFIQCVDPNQYIATLADNGFLNVKFIIQYGNKWLSQGNTATLTEKKGAASSSPSGCGAIEAAPSGSEDINKTFKNGLSSPFHLNLKKRRLILRKLKNISTLAAVASPSLALPSGLRSKKQPSVFPAKQPFGERSNEGIEGKTQPSVEQPLWLLRKGSRATEARKALLFLKESMSPAKNSSASIFDKTQLVLSKYKKKRSFSKKLVSIKIPLSRKYSAINFKTSSFKKLSKSLEFDILEKKQVGGGLHQFENRLFSNNFSKKQKSQDNMEPKRTLLKKNLGFLNSNPLTIDAVFNPITKVNYIIEVNDFKAATEKIQISVETNELYEIIKNPSLSEEISLNNNFEKELKKYMESNLIYNPNMDLVPSQFPSAIDQTELETILELKREINNLKKQTVKHNLTLEIWTNGSIHPRDALYEAFKNLIKLFSNLKKVNGFSINHFSLTSLSQFQSKNETQQKLLSKILVKKLKMGEITTTLLQELLPLNETSFLSTYVSPKLKNYFVNNEALSLVLKPLNDEMNQVSSLSTKNFSNENNVKKVNLYKTDIGVLNLSLRTYATLKRLHIHTIEELINFSKNNMLKSKNCNKSIVEEIKKTLLLPLFSL
jgi:DNA-directed RNA polymerase alpha subunit